MHTKVFEARLAREGIPRMNACMLWMIDSRLHFAFLLSYIVLLLIAKEPFEQFMAFDEAKLLKSHTIDALK